MPDGHVYIVAEARLAELPGAVAKAKKPKAGEEPPPPRVLVDVL